MLTATSGTSYRPFGLSTTLPCRANGLPRCTSRSRRKMQRMGRESPKSPAARTSKTARSTVTATLAARLGGNENIGSAIGSAIATEIGSGSETETGNTGGMTTTAARDGEMKGGRTHHDESTPLRTATASALEKNGETMRGNETATATARGTGTERDRRGTDEVPDTVRIDDAMSNPSPSPPGPRDGEAGRRISMHTAAYSKDGEAFRGISPCCLAHTLHTRLRAWHGIATFWSLFVSVQEGHPAVDSSVGSRRSLAGQRSDGFFVSIFGTFCLPCVPPPFALRPGLDHTRTGPSLDEHDRASSRRGTWQGGQTAHQQIHTCRLMADHR